MTEANSTPPGINIIILQWCMLCTEHQGPFYQHISLFRKKSESLMLGGKNGVEVELDDDNGQLANEE